MSSEVPRKRVLVAEPDAIVAFIASHVLTRYDYAVDTVTTPDRLGASAHGYDCILLSGALAASAPKLDPSRVILLGDSVDGFKAFARLRKPLELDLLADTVNACVHHRR